MMFFDFQKKLKIKLFLPKMFSPDGCFTMLDIEKNKLLISAYEKKTYSFAFVDTIAEEIKKYDLEEYIQIKKFPFNYRRLCFTKLGKQHFENLLKLSQDKLVDEFLSYGKFEKRFEILKFAKSKKIFNIKDREDFEIQKKYLEDLELGKYVFFDFKNNSSGEQNYKAEINLGYYGEVIFPLLKIYYKNLKKGNVKNV